MAEAGEGSAPRMPPFPAGRLRTRPLPALLQLPLSHGHDSDPCALSSLVTHSRWLVWHFSVGRNGSLGMWAPPLLGGPLSLSCHHRNSTEKRVPGLLSCFLQPQASVTTTLPGSSTQGPCRRCSGGSAGPRGPTHPPSEVLMYGSPGGPPVLVRGFFVGRWGSQ